MFITFEGADGTGKTTQIERLARRLRSRGYEVITTREPGGTFLAEKIRDILLEDCGEAVHPETEALLYAAARAQHVRQVIRPALADGVVVISDRFIDSSLVYQGVGRNLGVELVREMNRPALDGLWPDITVLLDLPPEEAEHRRKSRQAQADRFETEDMEFKTRLRQGYLDLAVREPERIIRIGADQDVEQLEEAVWSCIHSRLSERGDLR